MPHLGTLYLVFAAKKKINACLSFLWEGWGEEEEGASDGVKYLRG
jgi:hypothetical protein